MAVNVVLGSLVALLAEGVDRNIPKQLLEAEASGSPSSRRAWIEISGTVVSDKDHGVALLAEGVDRNGKVLDAAADVWLSPSSRRAWIEI